MKFIFRILVVYIFASTALNGAEAVADDFQKAKRAYDDNKYAIAIKLLLPLANAGDSRAQNLTGEAYELGRGVSSNDTKAQFWFEKAVKQDYTPALRNLGIHLVSEFKNKKRGIRLLKTAAERGDAMAQWGLGLFLSRSTWGLPVDRAAARKWLLKAIEQKYAHAATYLLEIYRDNGDYVEAYKWDIIGQFLWERQGLEVKGPLLLPDVREKMTKSQIAESQHRAKAWLKTHGEKP